MRTLTRLDHSCTCTAGYGGPMSSSGTGPGEITPDGCAVDLYGRLSAAGEPEIVHAAVPAGSSVLELGCGTGRISTGLARLGHPVAGVDESGEMLRPRREIETG